jgi:hypothetical protein
VTRNSALSFLIAFSFAWAAPITCFFGRRGRLRVSRRFAQLSRLSAIGSMHKTSTAVGSLLSHITVRAGSSLGPVREVDTPPLSNGPFLRHQQTSVIRRHVEDFIDFMTAQVDPIDALGEFPNKSHSHD